MVIRYLEAHLIAAVSVVLTFHLLGTRRTPQSTLGWLVGLLFAPLLAIPAYLLFGTRKLLPRTVQSLPPGSPIPLGLPGRDEPLQRLLGSAGVPPARTGNRFTLLPTGEQAFSALLEQIRSAQRTIHLSFFILGDDATGWAVIEALAERARAGVEVRVILDAAGSERTCRRARRRIADAGGTLRAFMPLLHVPFREKANLRSHRKLAVFDGRVLFTGGMNLAVEYMGATPRADRWRDLAALISGPVAHDAELLFASDWAFCGGTASDLHIGAPAHEAEGTTAAQWVASGPDVPGDPLYDGFLSALFAATRRAVIVTPYYVPDAGLHRAVAMAARRGVRTQVVIPERSNHTLADYARRGMIRDLRAVGVEVWTYPHGMVHAKTMIVDDRFGYIGSPNFDMRSLNLNYESALFLYDPPEIAQVEAWVDALVAQCVADHIDVGSIGFVEEIARLASPEI